MAASSKRTVLKARRSSAMVRAKQWIFDCADLRFERRADYPGMEGTARSFGFRAERVARERLAP